MTIIAIVWVIAFSATAVFCFRRLSDFVGDSEKSGDPQFKGFAISVLSLVWPVFWLIVFSLHMENKRMLAEMRKMRKKNIEESR